MEDVKDPTEIPGQVDLFPGSPDPVVDADPSARSARLARGSRILSDAERQQLQAAQSCSVVDTDEAGTGCTQVLHLCVFFDGTGNNRDEEMAKPKDRWALSNIARLYFSHKVKTDNVERLYLAGVGTPCPEVGDNGGMLGAAIGKGGGERVDYAMQQLDDLIGKQAAKKILVINVSVFGFSRGAAQARAFMRDLAARCKAQPDGTWQYRDIPLRLMFAGIFDTVCSVWGNLVAAVVNANDGHGEWAHDMKLPPIVEQCVHMTAAHELRKQFPLDSTRDNAHYPANTIEVWYPGVHSDVGGGYDPAHQGRKNSIARFALNEMYDMARAAGVLLRPIDKLDPQIQEEFNKGDEGLRSAYNGYLQSMRRKHGKLESVQAAHMELLHRWLKKRVTEGEDNEAVQRLRMHEEALEGELKTLRQQRSRLPNPYAENYRGSTPDEQTRWNELDAKIRDRQSQLSDVSKQRKGLLREANTLERRMTQLREKEKRGAKLTMPEQTMLSAWNNPAPLPESVEKFFNDYGHDSISHWFTGDLTRWRTIYFGDTKYKPESTLSAEVVASEAEVAEAVY